MSRQPRIDAPATLHHIICRGIERRRIFTDDDDRNDFLNRLSTILSETGTTCYAWALIPNHFHLLLRTGTTSLSTVMRRLLTGYALAFNHRHKRSGHLFQNRYKSIICQDDLYLLELLRYIHLNPLRAGLVQSVEELPDYSACGHAQLLGLSEQRIIAVDEVLSFFAKDWTAARELYTSFIVDGAAQGRRPELVGGGLARSLAGPQGQTRDASDYQMVSDERILGNSDFVQLILEKAEEQLTARQRYQAAGFDLDQLTALIAGLLNINSSLVQTAGKQPEKVRARSLFCYWAVRELGYTATALARRLGISQPAVSQAVNRGEKLVAERGWLLRNLINL